MSSHGGGGGGPVIAVVLLVAFVALIWIAFASFPPAGISPSGGGVSSSTAGGGLPIAPPAERRPPTATGTEPAGQAPNFDPYPDESPVKPAPSVAPKKSGGGSAPRPAPVPPASVPAAPVAVVPAEPEVRPEEIPEGFTVKQLSPYFRKISLGSITVGDFETIGQVSLFASLGENERVDVTGWRIQGNRGALFVPKAVQVYDVQGLAPEVNVVMRSGDTLSMYSGGRSAVGKNIRVNKCLGYLPTIGSFEPTLYASCPYFERAEISGFSGQCQEYINSLGSCGIADFSDVRIPQIDYACRAFLERLNYKGCVERYGGDKDFLQSQIYAWIGAVPFDRLHDKIKLFDGKGLLVNTYEY